MVSSTWLECKAFLHFVLEYLQQRVHYSGAEDIGRDKYRTQS